MRLIDILFYGKPYDVLEGKYKCKLAYNFFIIVSFKKDRFDKKYGYHNFWYDGYFHFFGLYPILIGWYRRPVFHKENNK